MTRDAGSRPLFSSRFGAVMAFIGVAVGLGNVWRFPYMAGAFGGGAFLVLYLLLLLAFGIPALMAELTLGRMTRRGPVGAFAAIGMPGGRVLGGVLFFTVLMAVSYYTVIVGWVLRYFMLSAGGEIGGVAPNAFFDAMLGGFVGQAAMTVVVLGLAGAVMGLGIRDGVERVSTVGMPILFLLLLVLGLRSLFLPGALEGLEFYLLPDFSELTPGVVTAALGQVFFSLSLGGTFLLTYGSYLRDDADLKESAVGIGVGDMAAAALAGLMIVPAAVALGLELDSGPPLMFITVPSLFARMPAGSLFAALFFGALFFAAFLSAVAAFEVLVAGLTDGLGWRRGRAIAVVCSAALVLAIVPMSSLDYIVTSDLLWGSTMQPVGSALTILGLAWIVGRTRALEEVNRGVSGRRVGGLWYVWLKWFVPLGIVLILGYGLADLFGVFLE